MAILRADVEALTAIARRDQGEPIGTPKVPNVDTAAESTGETLRAAFDGWKRERRPSPRTLTEYERAIYLFVELHGDMPVVQIKRMAPQHHHTRLRHQGHGASFHRQGTDRCGRERVLSGA